MALMMCVAGKNGLMFWKNSGNSCSGNDPPPPVTCTMSSSTAMALPRLANRLTIV